MAMVNSGQTAPSAASRKIPPEAPANGAWQEWHAPGQWRGIDDRCSYRGMNISLYERVMDEHTHEVSSVAYLEAIMMTLQRSSLFLLLALHDNIRKLFLELNINNANGAEIEDM